MDQQEALRQLQIADFAIQEAALFLNSHPEDENALSYYNKVKAYHERLHAQVVAGSGPLTNRENTGETWQYIHGKWPWEGGM